MAWAHRAFDIAGACAGLIVFAPAMIVIAIAILIDDGAPVLFRQERVGYRRRRFEILKFRSMRDRTVTRVGRVLRATGLDELPQFLNMLRGDMSAVGPRPLTADDVSRLGWSGSACDFRWSCRPGLTGLAQLLGATAGEDSLQFDRVHAETWRPTLDCRMIAWSFAVNAFGKARVRRWLRARYVRLNASRVLGGKPSSDSDEESDGHDRSTDVARDGVQDRAVGSGASPEVARAVGIHPHR